MNFLSDLTSGPRKGLWRDLHFEVYFYRRMRDGVQKAMEWSAPSGTVTILPLGTYVDDGFSDSEDEYQEEKA